MRIIDVIVVGAGPVGLMLAGELRLGGADVAVYDAEPSPSGESRALGFNRRAAESLGQRGVLDRIGSFRWGPMGHFGGVRFDLGMLDEDHSGVLGLSQARTEEALAGWLADLGVPVVRGREVTGLRETGDGVVVSYDSPEGPGEASAAYVVGCDGVDSTVRRLAGIAAPGWASTRGMYTAEITGAAPRPRPIGERLPGGSMVVCTPVGEGRFRVVVHDLALPANPDTETLTFTQVADAWQRLTGESLHDAEPQWLWATGNSAALAEEFRRGRVLLAGDAAHEIPPLAAWGLSAGLQDAVNLGWKLAATVRGWAPEGLLDTYDAERRPVGRELIRNARAAGKIYLSGEEMDPVREVMGELLAQKDAAERAAGIVSGLGVRYELGKGEHPLLGLRMPPGRELALADGATARVGDLLRTGHGLLITTDPAHARLAEGLDDRLDVVTGAWSQEGEPALETVLVRPDGYVAWTSPGTVDTLVDTLTRWFGTAQR
ncbi:FAD-dependent monooxygenase [Streptomyces sp. YPW6]|uniref:FAD-dependent monooxygenase n=1 Tax=Streptomyces sp. YPW6 TaxID=2840373 RepID=UPI001C0C03C6|nr:FAD-dependent monooxygenase [Streptomyces sp. YPW6]QWQ41388.1 FAD-dependent monooxygenase [Streptomyces sp. YPW6]